MGGLAKMVLGTNMGGGGNKRGGLYLPQEDIDLTSNDSMPTSYPRPLSLSKYNITICCLIIM